jgi:alpha-glucuronidase
MTPLGLHHIMARRHHSGPGPWVNGRRRDDWTATYYHRASDDGIGFDRISAGSNAIEQYSPEVRKQWENPETISLDYLLWFHLVAWDKTLFTGKTLWEELALRYQRGVEGAKWMQFEWDALEGKIDNVRFGHIQSFKKYRSQKRNGGGMPACFISNITPSSHCRMGWRHQKRI